jgi:hypothetical protein
MGECVLGTVYKGICMVDKIELIYIAYNNKSDFTANQNNAYTTASTCPKYDVTKILTLYGQRAPYCLSHVDVTVILPGVRIEMSKY